jgi:alpha-L-arabinofuranosidase
LVTEIVIYNFLSRRKGKIGVDMISLFPDDTYKVHGMRKDLAETIAALHPKFMRFPGGCMAHGQGLSNIYRWKETVGPWQDRVPAPNIWKYHQTRGLGFYEYFQFCEDIGAEPLPVSWQQVSHARILMLIEMDLPVSREGFR